ncbi:lytic transglycosylase domain-containing protein [Bacillaceae bacterium]
MFTLKNLQGILFKKGNLFNKKWNKQKKKKLGLFLLLLFLFIFLNSSFFWKLMYPVSYKKEVMQAAAKYRVDPFLILAIIQIESNFTSDRISHKGAVGMMQIMPDTAEWIIEQAGFSPLVIHDLDEPRINIEIGSWYLSFLEKQFDRNVVAVIAAYNAGPGKVLRWLREDVWDGSYQNLQQIPYGETRHYVQRVLYYYDKYQEIYRDEFDGRFPLAQDTR